MNTRFLYFTWAVIWFQLKPVRSGKTCATFEFPGLPDLKVVGKENTIINVHFNVKEFHCKGWDNTVIYVSKLEGRLKYFRIKCIIHVNRRCISSEESLCRCVSPGSYLFTKALHRTDNTQWKWSTDDGSVEEKVIEFNVTYPANVKSLIMEEIKDLNDAKFSTNLSFKCEWENGNPPSTLRLLDTHGKVIGNSTASGTLIQQLYNVTCNDIGIIRCDAEGSIRNESATLNLECSPEFINETKQIAVTPGQNVTFSSPIRSHTLGIDLCQMTKLSDDCYQSSHCLSDICNMTYSCTESKRNEVSHETETQKCRCALSGIVPNLNLDIFFSKITVFEFGLWKLIVNNNVGTDLLYVCIQPYPGPVSNTSPPLKWVITGSVIGVLTITLILILVLKKFKEPVQDPSQDSPLIQLEPIYHEIHEQSTSTGEDIDEGVFSMKTQNPYKEL